MGRGGGKHHVELRHSAVSGGVGASRPAKSITSRLHLVYYSKVFIPASVLYQGPGRRLSGSPAGLSRYQRSAAIHTHKHPQLIGGCIMEIRMSRRSRSPYLRPSTTTIQRHVLRKRTTRSVLGEVLVFDRCVLAPPSSTRDADSPKSFRAWPSEGGSYPCPMSFLRRPITSFL